MEKFFLQTSLGLEFVTAQQLSQGPRAQTGGVEVTCSMIDGLLLNSTIRTTNRVLLRIGDFKAKDFPTLFQRTQKLPWRQFVEKGEVTFTAATHQSRLKIKERIEQTCTDAYFAFNKGHEPKNNASTHSLEVFVRIQDDLATFSVNSSGEPLYKRGEKLQSVEAPIRETMAAALVRLMEPGSETIQWIDPMAGSGTLILEAAARSEIVRSRHFAFENWPLFKSIQKEYESKLKTFVASPNQDSFVACDIAPKALNAMKENLKNRKVTIQNQDLFSGETPASHPNRFVITNPPYGERLSTKGSPLEYFNSVLTAIATKYQPQKIGVVVPESAAKIKSLNRYSQKLAVPFQHGGQSVVFLIFIQK